MVFEERIKIFRKPNGKLKRSRVPSSGTQKKKVLRSQFTRKKMNRTEILCRFFIILLCVMVATLTLMVIACFLKPFVVSHQGMEEAPLVMPYDEESSDNMEAVPGFVILSVSVSSLARNSVLPLPLLEGQFNGTKKLVANGIDSTSSLVDLSGSLSQNSCNVQQGAASANIRNCTLFLDQLAPHLNPGYGWNCSSCGPLRWACGVDDVQLESSEHNVGTRPFVDMIRATDGVYQECSPFIEPTRSKSN